MIGHLLDVGKALLEYNVVRGALAGAASAALVDYGAFRTWKNWHEVATYDWPTAWWRWIQGAVTGAVAAFGAGWAAS